ncbi:WXG100 family type VII secretion target [Gordonia sp. NPDC003425]
MESGGTQIEVVPDELKQFAAILVHTSNLLRTGLTTAGSDVDHLTNGGWTGAAAASYAHGWAQCHKAGTSILNVLDRLANSVDAAGNGYAQGDFRSADDLSLLKL